MRHPSRTPVKPPCSDMSRAWRVAAPGLWLEITMPRTRRPITSHLRDRRPSRWIRNAGESTCRRGSVHPSGEGLGDHPSQRPTWGLSGLPDGRAAHVPRLALLRVGFTKQTESPRSLVRSYRTVSTLPEQVSLPSAVCFLWHCPAGHPDSRFASTLLFGAPTFLDPKRTWSRGHPVDSPA